MFLYFFPLSVYSVVAKFFNSHRIRYRTACLRLGQGWLQIRLVDRKQFVHHRLNLPQRADGSR